jgi:hypothetical protein
MYRKEIKTVRELAGLFREGELKKEDNDVIIFDKGQCELYTEKEYYFSMDYGNLAWQYLEELGVHVADA